MTQSILDEILAHKRAVEVPERKRAAPLAGVRREAEAAPRPLNFAAALRRPDGRVALIAEVKRASPSKGDLVKGAFDPAALARLYEASGASAISVLTDARYFKGSLEHLAQVRQAVRLPLLRKDFVVDPYQLYEARAAGADAALLIVAALDPAELADLHALAVELGLAPLVEVHDEAEAGRALAVGARVVGVNNRDLRTFVTDLGATEKCARSLGIGDWGLEIGDRGTGAVSNLQSPACNLQSPVPNPPLLVSESGLFTPGDVAAVARAGASAVLVGESIITSGDIAGQVKALAGVPLPSHG
jgi:indole-3-glycerol phosphate synthase